MPKPLVSIIIPTFNEAAGIATFLQQLQTMVNQWAVKSNCESKDLAEVIVVDDNSPDGTADVVRQFKKTWPVVRIVVRTTDRGLGASILAGIQTSNGAIIVGMDADGNHDATQVPELVAALIDRDLVVASRFIGGGGMQQRWRWLATLLFNFGLRVLGFPVWDNFSGFYAIRKQKLFDLGLDSIYYGYGDYHLRLVFFAAKKGLKIKEVPTVYLPRLGGRSKSHLLSMAYNYTKEALRLRLSR